MRSLAIAICILMLALTAFAQGETATVNGVVSDTNRAPVAGTSIQMKNVENGSIYRAVSNPGGNYTLAKLPPGKYEMSATSFGFKPYERKDIVVQAGQTLRIDIPVGDFISLDTLGEDRNGLGRIFLSRKQP